MISAYSLSCLHLFSFSFFPFFWGGGGGGREGEVGVDISDGITSISAIIIHLLLAVNKGQKSTLEHFTSM